MAGRPRPASKNASKTTTSPLRGLEVDSGSGTRVLIPGPSFPSTASSMDSTVLVDWPMRKLWGIFFLDGGRSSQGFLGQVSPGAPAIVATAEAAQACLYAKVPAAGGGPIAAKCILQKAIFVEMGDICKPLEDPVAVGNGARNMENADGSVGDSPANGASWIGMSQGAFRSLQLRSPQIGGSGPEPPVRAHPQGEGRRRPPSGRRLPEAAFRAQDAGGHPPGKGRRRPPSGCRMPEATLRAKDAGGRPPGAQFEASVGGPGSEAPSSEPCSEPCSGHASKPPSGCTSEPSSRPLPERLRPLLRSSGNI
ncbi:hypothetical protein GUJ93_ZPchr0009g1749 [Zizania palustris]|uniref:Uncharacterized protein n=1 Tax=Zizania palustris TaxID=103762 RepID=A0A8J5R3Z5_ZIZPA|nr:hypothetical protein GUJ93_ZPchr0009g1749 [Zizania palustris]